MTDCVICGQEIEDTHTKKSRVNDGDKYFWHEKCESDQPLAAHFNEETGEFEVVEK